MKIFRHAILPLLLMAFVPGCRQSDVRIASIPVDEALALAENQKTVLRALGQISGIETTTAVFTNGCLTVRYDSMKLALKNIEHAIMDAGFDAGPFKGKKRQ